MEPVQLVKWFPTSKCLTPFMRRWSVIPWFVLGILCTMLVYWAMDRVEPVVVLRQEKIPQVRAGEVVLLEAIVKRDRDPQCAVEVSRVIVTAGGYRFPPEEFRYSKNALSAIVERGPDVLRAAVRVPEGIPKGRAVLQTLLQYHCNPLDRLWPISTVTELQFDVV